MKYNFSKITVITTNTCAKTYKQLFTKFLISIKLRLVCPICTKYWWILPILSVLCPANNFQWRFM